MSLDDVKMLQVSINEFVISVHPARNAYPAAEIRVRGPESMVTDIVKALKERCPECGRMNGTHQETFRKTGQYNGSVEGNYSMCSRSNDQ